MADRQYIDIPILGLDRRQSERQSVPGLCDTLHNLEPSGDPRRPYWKAVPRSDEIRNEAGEPFRCDNQGSIVSFGWHTRNSVGKYSSYEGASLRRLVCLFDDGQLKVFDPNGWEEVVTKQYGQSGDMFSGQFETFNDALVILVKINGEPGDIELLVDDLIVPFEFPEVPVVQMETLTKGFYSSEEFENELYEGIRGPSTYYIKYALRLTDGTLVKHTSPFRVSVTAPFDGATEGTRYFRFFLEGYEQIEGPEFLDFWQDYIQGVVVLCSFDASVAGQAQQLENALFYEIASFDTINALELDADQRVEEFDGRDLTINTRKQSNIDNFTHHTTRFNVIDAFNSRLLAGGVETEFAQPALPRRAGILPFSIRASQTLGANPKATIRVFGVNALALDASGSGVTNIQTESSFETADDFPTVITADITSPAGDYNITLSYSSSPSINKNLDFSYTISKQDFEAGDWVNVSSGLSGNNSGAMKLVVTIEAGTGIYEVAQQGESRYWQMVSGGGQRADFRDDLITYPDRRAKSIELYNKYTIETLDPATGESGSVVAYYLTKKIELKPSDTQNFAFYKSNPAIIDIGLDGDDVVNLPESSNNKQYQPNRMQASEVNDPFAFIASRSNIIGRGSNQLITAFATNTLPVSDGQFGQYPIYVFTEHSIYALEQSTDPLVAFARVSPVSTSHGCKGPQQITNSGQSIIFLYKDGVYALSGTQADPISDPVNNYPGAKRLDFGNAILSSHKRGEDDEIHVCDGGLTYVYNLKYGRWFTTDKLRSFYTSDTGVLYGMTEEGLIYDEDDLLIRNPVKTTFSYRPVHFGSPEELKRVFSVAVRGTQAGPVLLEVKPKGTKHIFMSRQPAIRMKHKSTYSFQVECNAQMVPDSDLIEGITAQVEQRYPHKNRQVV